MRDSFEQLKELQRHVELDGDAKHRIRERLVLYASLKPQSHAPRAAASPGMVFSSFFMARGSRVLAASLVMAIAGVSSIKAAEGAIPGDLLYPIKVHVNEEARALFARSAESKAAFEVSRLSRRLKEAEQLAVEGRLSEETESELAAQIDTHSRNARTLIAGSSKEGSTLEVQRLETTLISTIAAHDGVIADLSSTAASGDVQPAQLPNVQSVLQEQKNAAAVATSTATNIDTEGLRTRQVALGQALVALEHRIEEEATIGTTTRVQAFRLFGDAMVAHADAKQAIRTENETGAYAALLRGEQAIEELETLLSVGVILKAITPAEPVPLSVE